MIITIINVNELTCRKENTFNVSNKQTQSTKATVKGLEVEKTSIAGDSESKDVLSSVLVGK